MLLILLIVLALFVLAGGLVLSPLVWLLLLVLAVVAFGGNRAGRW